MVLAGVSGCMGGEKAAQLGELIAVRLAKRQGDRRTLVPAVIVVQISEGLFPAVGSDEWAGVRQVKPVNARACSDVEIFSRGVGGTCAHLEAKQEKSRKQY